MMHRVLIPLQPFRRRMMVCWMNTNTTTRGSNNTTMIGNNAGNERLPVAAAMGPFSNNINEKKPITMKKNPPDNGNNENNNKDKSVSKNDKETLPPLPPRQPPETLRRLVVQRKQQQEEKDQQQEERSSNKSTSPTSSVYRRKRRPSTTETRDTAGQLILQQTTTHRNHHYQHPKVSNQTRAINSPRPPLLNAAVWLDTTRYIKQSSTANTSRSGTEGARRLLRGRHEWMKAVKKHVQRGKATEYTLTGHGVPPQLLQHVVQYWHEQYQQATALQSTMIQHHQQEEKDKTQSSQAVWELHATSSAAAPITEPHHVQRALVRRVTLTTINQPHGTAPLSTTTTTSITHRLPITSFPSPFDAPVDEAEAPENTGLALYLTVMHRLASALAVVLKNTDDADQEGDDDDSDNKNNSQAKQRSRAVCPPTAGVVSRWHVVVGPVQSHEFVGQAMQGDPRVAVAWHGSRQVFIHLYGKNTKNNESSDSDDDDDKSTPVLRIVYQAQIQRSLSAE